MERAFPPEGAASVAVWNPESTGHALFATGIGVCGIAWGAHGVVALQLPEAQPGATRDRMLAGALRRRPGRYRACGDGADLPLVALQAVRGVQALLANRGADAGWGAEDRASPPAEPGEGAAVIAEMVDASTAGMGLPDLTDIVLDWHGVSAFHQQVYALTRAVGPGQTCSYASLAQALGGVGLSRAVGQALGLNPFAPVVPCHRVLTTGRQPGGFSGGGGVLTKLRMLEIEGAAWGGTRSLFEGL